MKKFAVLAATLICFGGCARNDTGEMGATESDTATGAAGTSQTGTEYNTSRSDNMTGSGISNTNETFSSGSATWNADTNNVNLGAPGGAQQDTLNQDTNNVSQPNNFQGGAQSQQQGQGGNQGDIQ